MFLDTWSPERVGIMSFQKNSLCFTLSISRAEFMNLVSACKRELPNEACGLLGGITYGRLVSVTVYPTENLMRSPVGFRISAKQIKKVKQLIQARGEQLCGCYHSHPTAPAIPSSTDSNYAFIVGFWWVIYSPLYNSVRAYYWDGRRFHTSPLRISSSSIQ
jgi:proteasome lid subunit RPN8/RPN11